MKHNVPELLNQILAQEIFISATLSNPRKGEIGKISIRPIIIQDKYLLQISEHFPRKVVHRNENSEECKKLILEWMEIFKQALFFTSEKDFHLLVNKSGEITVLRKPPTQKLPVLQHNRQKNYLLEEGKPVPFLVALGITNAAGKFLPGKRDKFVQINRFLEVVQDILPAFDLNKPLRIVDFGCGKAYLTFGLYYYLKEIQGIDVSIVGLDLKKDVIDTCQSVVQELRLQGLTFHVGDIIDYVSKEPIDMVVVLHACDTATDAALAQALKWNAKAILAAPCCQHELYNQVESKELDSILRYGLLRERFASLTTDAARATILEIKGYKVQLLEFIDAEHTPKNLMIRALLNPSKEREQQAQQRYKFLKETLQIYPTLEKLVF